MTVIDSNRSCEEQFDLFCSANSLISILNHFHQLCAIALRAPLRHPWDVYKGLNARLKSYWKASALFKKLDKKVQCAEYSRQSVCEGLNVLVIGCGPCGLRCAIELALLGSQVVVIEKRDSFSRNNVLHLWPYLIDDLRSLGAKTFFGKFCAGSIDHISIRTLQCILLKAALLFGVHVFPGVLFRRVLEPTSDLKAEPAASSRVFQSDRDQKPVALINKHSNRIESCQTPSQNPSKTSTVNGKNKNNSVTTATTIGWRVQVEPEIAVLKNFEIDVLIGADGKRSCLGFPCKELRCRLAIAITANFINYHTQAEAEVEEISGVASIFNQQFFARLSAATGIDLENLVYYKDETHYFVMTAKKHSLLAKGVLKHDRDDSVSLLNPDNVNNEALQAYARETANFVTDGRLPHLDFALNARGEPDVDAFDFTRMFAAEYSCRIIDRKKRLLMQCLIGDGLFEPFWPTGSGCALGFLSALDAAWAVKRLASGANPLNVLAQRESVYQRLSQTTAQNMPPNFADYTLDPRSRYIRCNLNLFTPYQVLHLYDTDQEQQPSVKKIMHTSRRDAELAKFAPNRVKEEVIAASSQLKNSSLDHTPSLSLLRWLQYCLSFYVCWGIVDYPADITPEIWDSGYKLLCLIHLYRPELVPEIDKFINNEEAGIPVEECSIFGSRGSCDTRPSPVLVRACGTFIEYFDVVFSESKDTISIKTATSTFPRSTSDWFAYLSLVQRALSPLKMVLPKRPPAERMALPCVASISPRGSPTPLRKATVRNGLSNGISNTRTKPELRVGNAIKRVFRENPKLAVEKGLMSKRRTELMATLRDPASAKRGTPLSHTISMNKRSSVSSNQLNRLSGSSMISELLRSNAHADVVRSSLTHLQQQPAVIKPVTIPPSVARLFAPQKSSSYCYICQKRLYLTERQTDFDLYFHRHCFRCAECGIQLQPGKATRVRAQQNQLLDSFYCLTHSLPSEPDFSRTGKFQNSACDASLVDRLKSRQFPFGFGDTASTNNVKNHNGFRESAQLKPNIPCKLNRPSVPIKSAILAGLNGDPDSVMGVSSVRAVVPSKRLISCESSSSSSPLQMPRRKIVLGPAGDSTFSKASGIRDERAPSPGCFLAGHLGLPEMERRANWELNTNSALISSSFRDSRDGLRFDWARTSAWDDYLASSESEDPSPTVPISRSTIRPRLPRQQKINSTNVQQTPFRPHPVQSDSCSSSSSSPSPYSSTTNRLSHLSPFPLIGYGQSSTNRHWLSSPIHSFKQEAKQRFCMEPPKPVSIDPKQFIGTKNRERTTTSVLSDCSESLIEISDIDVCQASVSSTVCPLRLSESDSSTLQKSESVHVASSEQPLSLRHSQYSPLNLQSAAQLTHTPDLHVTPDTLPTPNTDFFALLDDFKDIDSLSTLTDRSSVEQTPEPIVKPHKHPTVSPRSSDKPLVMFSTPSTFLGEYDNIQHLRAANVPAGYIQDPKASPHSDSSETSSADLDSVVKIRPHSATLLKQIDSKFNSGQHHHQLIDIGHIPCSTQLQRELRLLEMPLKRSTSESSTTTRKPSNFVPIPPFISVPPTLVSSSPLSALPPHPHSSRRVASVHSSPVADRRVTQSSIRSGPGVDRRSDVNVPVGPNGAYSQPLNIKTHVYRIYPRKAIRSLSDSLLDNHHL